MATYTLIASSTVGAGGTSSVTFTSIPSTYTDLLVKASVRSGNTGGQANLVFTFNGVGSGYYGKNLIGNGSSASSQSDSNVASLATQYTSTDGMTSNTFGNVEIYIPNYTGSTAKNLSSDFVAESNATNVNYIGLSAGSTNATTAISSITISAGASLMQYSSIYLYGIKNS
jgi:hypothetical protein